MFQLITHSNFNTRFHSHNTPPIAISFYKSYKIANWLMAFNWGLSDTEIWGKSIFQIFTR
jgi:hypothetical protein